MPYLGDFMGFFFKRKPKKRRVDEAFSSVYEQIRHIENWDDPKKLEHYILDSCEQIISHTKEIQAQKAEVSVVNSYLEDIKTLEGISQEKQRSIREAASQIVSLKKAKNQYLAMESKLSEEQYILMEQEESTMHTTIRRMLEHERYQDQVRREKIMLEGQKSQWAIEQDRVAHGRKLMRRVSTFFLSTYAVFLGLLVLIRVFSNFDLTNAFLVLFCLGAVGAILMYLKMLSMNTNMKKARYNYNQTIGLLNIVTMKYVHVTKSVDYTKDKFKVHNSTELNYLWEQYLEEVRRKELFIRNNDDLEFFHGRLMRLLGTLELNDRKVWLTQVEALINPEEMENVRQSLEERRARILEHIKENRAIVKSERDEIDNLMAEHQHYLPEIVEIIKSVDKICNLESR